MDAKELLQVIEQAAEEGWTELDLSEKGLTKLLPEIGQLTDLTELNLIGNQLTALPPEIGQLTSLTELYFGRAVWNKLYSKISNHLTELPSEIGQLTNLTTLDLSNNKLTELPSEIGQLTNLRQLDLSLFFAPFQSNREQSLSGCRA